MVIQRQLELVFKGKDNASSTIIRLRKELATLGTKQYTGDRLARNIDSMRTSAAGFGSILTRIAYGAMATLIAKVYVVQRVFRSLASEFRDVNERFANLEISIKSTMKSAVAARQISNEIAKITAYSPIAFQKISDIVKSLVVMPQTRQNLVQQASEGTLSDQNGFLRKAIKLIEQMTTFRPDQGANSAIFALREALSGELRSLIRRFDIPSSVLTAASGKSIQELKGDPNLMFEAFTKAFDKIITPEAISEFARQPSILMENLVEQVIQIPLLKIGQAGLYEKFLKGFQNLFDKITEYISSSFQGTANRLSAIFSRMLDELSLGFTMFIKSLLDMFKVGGEDENLVKRSVKAIESFGGYLAEKLPEVLAPVLRILPSLLKVGRDVSQMFLTLFTAISKLADMNIFTALLSISAAIGIFKSLKNDLGGYVLKQAATAKTVAQNLSDTGAKTLALAAERKSLVNPNRVLYAPLVQMQKSSGLNASMTKLNELVGNFEKSISEIANAPVAGSDLKAQGKQYLANLIRNNVGGDLQFVKEEGGLSATAQRKVSGMRSEIAGTQNRLDVARNQVAKTDSAKAARAVDKLTRVAEKQQARLDVLLAGPKTEKTYSNLSSSAVRRGAVPFGVRVPQGMDSLAAGELGAKKGVIPLDKFYSALGVDTGSLGKEKSIEGDAASEKALARGRSKLMKTTNALSALGVRFTSALGAMVRSIIGATVQMFAMSLAFAALFWAVNKLVSFVQSSRKDKRIDNDNVSFGEWDDSDRKNAIEKRLFGKTVKKQVAEEKTGFGWWSNAKKVESRIIAEREVIFGRYVANAQQSFEKVSERYNLMYNTLADAVKNLSDPEAMKTLFDTRGDLLNNAKANADSQFLFEGKKLPSSITQKFSDLLEGSGEFNMKADHEFWDAIKEDSELMIELRSVVQGSHMEERDLAWEFIQNRNTLLNNERDIFAESARSLQLGRALKSIAGVGGLGTIDTNLLGLDNIASDVFLEDIRTRSQSMLNQVRMFGDYEDKFGNTAKAIAQAMGGVAKVRETQELPIGEAIATAISNINHLASVGLKSEQLGNVVSSLYTAQITFAEQLLKNSGREMSAADNKRLTALRERSEYILKGGDSTGEIRASFTNIMTDVLESLPEKTLEEAEALLAEFVKGTILSANFALKKDLGSVLSDVIPRFAEVASKGYNQRLFVLDSMKKGVYNNLAEIDKQLKSVGDFSDAAKFTTIGMEGIEALEAELRKNYTDPLKAQESQIEVTDIISKLYSSLEEAFTAEIDSTVSSIEKWKKELEELKGQKGLSISTFKRLANLNSIAELNKNIGENETRLEDMYSRRDLMGGLSAASKDTGTAQKISFLEFTRRKREADFTLGQSVKESRFSLEAERKNSPFNTEAQNSRLDIERMERELTAAKGQKTHFENAYAEDTKFLNDSKIMRPEQDETNYVAQLDIYGNAIDDLSERIKKATGILQPLAEYSTKLSEAKSIFDAENTKAGLDSVRNLGDAMKDLATSDFKRATNDFDLLLKEIENSASMLSKVQTAFSDTEESLKGITGSEEKLREKRAEVNQLELTHYDKVKQALELLLKINPAIAKESYDRQYTNLLADGPMDADYNSRLVENRQSALDAKVNQGRRDGSLVSPATGFKEAFANEFEGVTDATRVAIDLGVAGANAMKSAFVTSWSAWVSGAQRGEEAMRNFAISVIDALQQIIAQEMAVMIIRGALGGMGLSKTATGGSSLYQSMGNAPSLGSNINYFPPIGGHAEGGPITKGDGYSDDQLSLLMRGEYVLRKKAASSLGLDFLNKLNEQGSGALDSLPRYAMGGSVGVAGSENARSRNRTGAVTTPLTGGITVNVSVDAKGNSQTSTEVDSKQAAGMGKTLGKAIEVAVEQSIRKMMYSGGTIDVMLAQRGV